MQNLPRETRLRMADLANTRDRKGIVGLSENSIRRLIADGNFPKPHQYQGITGKFYIYGEILDWMESQREACNG